SVVAIAPQDTLLFVASGGSGIGFSFRLKANGSGGSIDPQTGEYFAGARTAVVDEITVTDSLGNTAIAHVTIGDGLVVEPAAPSIPPRGEITFVVSGGSGTGYRFVLEGNGSNGSVDAATGQYRAGATANADDRLVVTDSLGNSATVIISVGEGISIAPTVATLAPRAELQFSARGGSGSGVRFTVATNASGGEIDADTGSYVAGAVPNVTDEIRVTDDLGNVASATVHIGAGLVINPPSASVAPKGALSFKATGGGGGYTFAVRGNGSGASIVSTTGVYTAGPRAGAHDIVEVTDGLGNLAAASVDVGLGLTLSPATPHVAAGAGATFTTSGGSGTGYRYALTMNGSGGTIDAVTGVYLAGATTDTVDAVTVIDSLGNTTVVNIAVGNALALNPAAPTVAPGESLTFVAVGGGGGNVFSLMSSPSHGTIDPATGRYRAGATANVTDIVMVTDAEARTAIAQVKVGRGITITPVESLVAPATRIRFLVAGGSGVGNRFAIATNASTATVDAEAGNYRAGTKGGVTDVVSVTDSLEMKATATVVIGAALKINAPGATVPPQGSLRVTAMGGAGDYTFTLSQTPSGGVINHSTGEYRAGKTGRVSDIVVVKDGNGVTDQVTITVGPGVSIAPAAPVVESEGTLQLAATGGSGTGYAWRIMKNKSGGSVDAASGRFVAGAVESGTVTDVVEVTDSLGNTGSASLEVGRGRRVTVG
ncbi:MAG: hypothetical protein ABUR63_07895, partial [Verrucomicrobiota bacterium]